MTYEITGTIEIIGEVQHVSPTFKKRDLVIKTVNENNYEDVIKFEFMQDKVDLLDRLKVGDETTVKFSIGGRAWTNSAGTTAYFNTLKAFYCSFNEQGQSQPAYTPPAQTPPPMPDLDDESEDDIPF